MLLKQHTALLKKKSRQVQRSLEEDKAFLDQLIEQEYEERQLVSARREQAKADARWMKQVNII